jgi:hypothetical protein
VPAVCPAALSIPSHDTPFDEAVRLAQVAVNCKHCLKIIEDYEPSEAPGRVPDGLAYENIIHTRTHYLLRYANVDEMGDLSGDITLCAQCRHPVHFYFDCADRRCACQWSVNDSL